MEFRDIVRSIVEVHKELSAQASRAVNLSITLRNWLIGCHIAVYELNGADRATYGERLLSKLSEELQKLNVSSVGKRQLYHYLKFYQTYPQIVRSLPAQLTQSLAWPTWITSSLYPSTGWRFQDARKSNSFLHTNSVKPEISDE